MTQEMTYLSFPAGIYKLVALEPSEEMLQSACLAQSTDKYDSYDAWWNSHSSGVSAKIRSLIADDYRAMLAAVPADLPGVVIHSGEPVYAEYQQSEVDNAWRRIPFNVAEYERAQGSQVRYLHDHPPAQPRQQVSDAQIIELRDLIDRLRQDAAGGGACTVFHLDKAADYLSLLAAPADLSSQQGVGQSVVNQAETRASSMFVALVESSQPAQGAQPIVAWVRRHPDGALTAEFLEDAVIEPTRKKSGAWVPLVIAQPQGAQQPISTHCGKAECKVCDDQAAFDRLAQQPDSKDAELRTIGSLMANLAFNLAQQCGHTLTSDDCSTFDVLRKQWDAAIASSQKEGAA